MPLYEYRCNACFKKSTVFTKSVSVTVNPICQHCKGTDLTRLVSRFAYHRPYEPSSGDMGPSGQEAPDPSYYQDPRNIGRRLEGDFQRMGVEMPKEVRERLDAAREGVMPKELDL
ncbi:MAG: hypothetical protein HYY31_04980 [Chloroflexi bacterium]|nr:hypothetical protein [Chloroflexota bacterium]